MANTQGRTSQTRFLVSMALMAAVIVVLQEISAATSLLLAFSITLALVPIVVGAALYGRKAGTILGAVFGAVVLINCVTGFDKGGSILWTASWWLTAVTCLGKGMAAGFAAGTVYHWLEKESMLAAVIVAALVSPIVNTGLFCLCMLFFFKDILYAWAGGTGIAYYLIFGLTGINFLIEVAVNMILSPIIVRIIRIGKKA